MGEEVASAGAVAAAMAAAAAMAVAAAARALEGEDVSAPAG